MHDPAARTVLLLNAHGVDTVLDVGANDGEFATSIRELGFTGKLISFEPLEEPFRALARRAEKDGNWDVRRIAIGSESGEVMLNVAGNAGQSSSILPMLDRHEAAAPSSRYVAQQMVPIARLDDLVADLDLGRRALLKIDVQGYEHAVLDGARDLLASGTVVGVQSEVSLVPVYEGAMAFEEAVGKMRSLGLVLQGIEPVFTDRKTGQVLQVDALFFPDVFIRPGHAT
ncbi:MAG TPA: FkbM family methyltransferase [Microbacteriaceae bacterium]|nr:FkbM family methyltransferase [Microbacteriaceae bacterium]